MNDVMGIALGGMRAAHQGVQVAAHNVANRRLLMPDACNCCAVRRSRAGCRPR